MQLENFGAIICRDKLKAKIVGELPYVAKFRSASAVTTVRFVLKDYQTDSDVVITNITTLPEDQRGIGYGSMAVQVLVKWAVLNRFNEVRATQISGDINEAFWSKNGFVKCQQPNPCNDFVCDVLSKHQPTGN